MVHVPNEGAKGSDIQRRELGEQSIPTIINKFTLKRPPANIPYVNVENMRSLQSVTNITKPNN